MPFEIQSPTLLAALAAFAAAPVCAQGCATATDTFWQRDTLPVAPAGLAGVSVIQGLCEGESAGVVFELPATMGPQKVTQVVAPWGAQGGIQGFQALLDVEVYDGVSFSGAVANMGTQVFRLGAIGANMQVSSHGLNVLDTSAYDITVGNAPPTGNPPVRRFAVCFRMDINLHPTGSCASGWPANFFTDNSQFSFTCDPTVTPARTSLIEILGQGWRDASQATVGGLPLCPFYYSGIWAIRCCTRDVSAAAYTTFGAGCAGVLPAATLTPVALPRIGTTCLVVLNNLPINSALMFSGFSNQTSALGPLPADLTAFGAPGCFARVGLDSSTFLLGSNATALWSLPLPNLPGLIGTTFYQQALVFDPGSNALGAVLSDAGRIDVGN